jgi:hypothetical protein
MSMKGSASFKILENHPADSRLKISEDGMCQTLSSRMGTGGQCSDGYGGRYERSCKKINALGV